jgi:hypothetical protein
MSIPRHRIRLQGDFPSSSPTCLNVYVTAQTGRLWCVIARQVHSLGGAR